jgi:hypothetical protein
MSEPGSFSALSAQVFQPPTAPVPPAPMAQPLTPSGGVGVPPGPVTVPGGTFSTPSPIQPQYAPQPVAPAPMTPVAPPPQPAPSRTQLDRLVQNGTFTAQDVQGISSDAELFDALLTLGQQSPSAAPASPPAAPPVPPVVPTPTPSAPARSDLTAAAQALQAHGLLEMRGGMYVPKAPEAQAIADSLNQQIQAREQVLSELNDPTSWLKKHGEPVFDTRFKTLEQRIEQLQNMLAEAAPKPHVQWVEQHKDQLYTEQNGQRVFSPAGNAYNQTWQQLADLGYTDVKQLHASASQAALAAMRAYQPAAPAPPPQSFMQAAQQYQAPVNPGFTAPGTMLSNQNPQTVTPVNTLGLPDFDAIAAGILNGSITSPRAM